MLILTAAAISGCCGGFQKALNEPFGPNSICEPVHRAHYDNGFEIGYGSECPNCGLAYDGARPACSCQQYGPEVQAVCLNCAMNGRDSYPNRPSTSPSTKTPHLAKKSRSIKQVAYTTGCTECAESNPPCDDCGEQACSCCTPRCPEVCEEYYPGPLGWLFTAFRPEKYYGGCGEIYWGDFHSYPPDCTDPCNRCGCWTGQCNGCAWTDCNVCGQCNAHYGESCQSCGHGAGEVIENSATVEEGPVLMSQTDRIARPKELESKKSCVTCTKRSTSTR